MTDGEGPLYQRLGRLLEADIREGRVTGMLPSMRTLMDEHGVSSTTVRSAVHHLAALGLVRLEHGRGVAITPGGPRPLPDRVAALEEGLAQVRRHLGLDGA